MIDRAVLLILSLAVLSLADDEWKNVHAHDDLENAAQEASNSVNNKINELKESAQTTAHELNETVHSAISENGVDNLKACTNEVQCNARGTCMGTQSAYLCLCNIGYSGKNCQDTLCESARDCNGRGLCLGTTTELTCLCNLGYSGKRCETKT